MTDGDLFEIMSQLVDIADQCQSEHLDRPSPKVAACVIKDGELIGVAHRGEDGAAGEHAEFRLLEKHLEGIDVSGATLLTTLEPCTTRSPTKRPCADWIIERGLAKVFIGMVDPNHDIRGSGIIQLQAAGIECQLFPHELATRIETQNLDFAKLFRPSLTSHADRILLFGGRSLDDWYLSINRIYWDRNSREDLTYFLAHLMEVAGGLSGIASGKIRDRVSPEAFIQKAFAWWLSLCGRAGVESVSEMILRKFPGVCPYCERSPHDDDACREAKRNGTGPNWASLSRRRSAMEPVPATLADWLRMFRTIYPVHQGEQYGTTFGRLAEELGELAEAVRLFEEAPNYFLSEAADVFAWLMRVENIRETKADTASAEIGDVLVNGFAVEYPDACLDCESRTCRCASVLKRTIGRIAKEMPDGEHADFMTPAQRRNAFGNW